MAYPLARMTWTRLGEQTAHVVVEPVPDAWRSVVEMRLCGRIPLEWLTNVYDHEAQVDVVLSRAEDCDHGGTYREPRSVWTGLPTP